LQQGEILTPFPSFPTLTRFGANCGASIKKVKMDGYTINLEQLFEQITETTSLVYICNPNNPTATEVDVNDLKDFCKKVPENVIICVDEAYLEYTKLGKTSSVANLIKDLPNLIVCRTFSKTYGLAGMRIGYALAQKELIQTLGSRHLGYQFSNSITSIVAATAALEDDDFIQKVVKHNETGRQILYKAFEKWEVPHSISATNFVYASTNRFQNDLVDSLREQKVLVSQWTGIMNNHFRISISTPEEMTQFVEILSGFLR